ncbi:hypothetical protein SELMODRAFT_402719 [Selaginella moellendorffii]|uniref:Uncharacterized protein n=2 Tax=Selaginella moellendorffii TaxID=88036 RepID=D8QMU3_SELML|nr:hypothetical protein SELMODRAFT_402719 [Selaginella moellendorffii]
MDDAAATLSTRRAVVFDIEQQPPAPAPQQDLPSSSSFQVRRSILKRPSRSIQEEGQEAGEARNGGESPWSEEDYDPYYGLGIRTRPDLPVLLVFNLMESRRFNTFSSPTRTRLFYAATILGGSIIASCLVFCIALLAFQLRERPELPIVRFKSVLVSYGRLYRIKPEVIRQQQVEGKGNYFAYKLNFLCEVHMNITNSNRHLDMFHHWIETTVYYHGTPIAVDRIDNIPHPRRGIIRPVFTAFAISLPLTVAVGNKLDEELHDPRLSYTGPTGLAFEIIVQSEISLLEGLRPLPFSWRCRCSILTDLLLDGFKCRCLDAKWRPREHLKYYRVPSWPRDETEIIENNFSYPDDYYDPSVNYYANTNSSHPYLYYT